ncbi:MAG: phosphoribosylformylglycinamidine synthase subunit PurL [Euryarchaeota archaeon]|nr:phosphoribosylformylglycinamidine synthase subunit PurL [Euryarchaeota archaeon]
MAVAKGAPRSRGKPSGGPTFGGKRGGLSGPFVRLRGLSARELQKQSAALSLGFSPFELSRLQDHFEQLGRDPTQVEIAGIAQSWSEHCSYKSSRPFLSKHFGSLPPDPRVLAKGDAGVMALSSELAYAIRIESHNHPSAVEPYGGAATGIGGILRDVLAMGAKPVALADPLFFGPLDLPLPELPPGVKHPRYLYSNVVAGIRDYGNRVGVPTIAGSITFDPAYRVNPLVNVACVGILPRRHLVPNRATAPGQALVLAGGLTGKDGLGGVAFASRELSENSEREDRGAVQLGNAIMKEPLIHAVLEGVEAGLIAGMKDLGGGGLASASGELVHAGGFGSELHLDRVPLREPGMSPWEIWISESQERMLMAVEPSKVSALLAIFARHDVPATVVGASVEGNRERLFFQDAQVAELDLDFRVDPPPVARSVAAPPPPGPEPTPPFGRKVAEVVEKLLLHQDSVSREPVIRVYDHEVQGRTVGKPLVGDLRSPTHADAAVLQVDPPGYLGLAVSVGSQPFLCAADPRRGGQGVVEEAARNLYAVGARPDAFTNCLNFGNPEDPRVLGEFNAVVAGMAEAARDLGMAVPSGNVSFYNGGLGAAIPPTPVVMATGILPDVRRRIGSDLKQAGDLLYLVGPTHPGLAGSLYLRVFGGHATRTAPYDGAMTRTLGEKLLALGQEGRLRACHDVSEGGLAVALPEMAFGGRLGFDVRLPSVPGLEPWQLLVAEGGSRWVIEVSKDDAPSVEHALSGLPCLRLGQTAQGRGTLRTGDRVLASLPLSELYPRWREGLEPRDMDGSRTSRSKRRK